MIASLNICAIVHGTVDDNVTNNGTGDGTIDDKEDGIFPYRVPKEMNIFHETKSSSNLTVREIMGRIEANQERFQRKYAKKMAAEDEYYRNRYQLNDQDRRS